MYAIEYYNKTVVQKLNEKKKKEKYLAFNHDK